jgi:hypothetical protein
MILAWYARLDDWQPDRNWYGGNRNQPPMPFQFYMWDTEYSLFGGSEPTARIHPLYRRAARTDSPNMVGIWHSIAASPEFMMLFADRVYQHCFHDGALTEENAIERWRTLNDHIASAVIAESARWGDAREALGELTRTRDGSYLPEVANVVGLLTGNVPRFIGVLRDEGYYPKNDPPEIRQETASALRLLNPNRSGDVLYTLDGTDPRAPGGAVSASALTVPKDAVVAVRAGQVLKARVKDGDEWAALARGPRSGPRPR